MPQAAKWLHSKLNLWKEGKVKEKRNEKEGKKKRKKKEKREEKGEGQEENRGEKRRNVGENHQRESQTLYILCRKITLPTPWLLQTFVMAAFASATHEGMRAFHCPLQ